VNDSYIWGDAIALINRLRPDFRIVNLETAITNSDKYWHNKGVHFKMNPENVGCLKAARIDCCVLANNHVLDWGHLGLKDTMDTLASSNIAIVGAGYTSTESLRPAVMQTSTGRVLVFAYFEETSGFLSEWAATENRLGLNLLSDLSTNTAREIAENVSNHRRVGDIVIMSIHWGENWGYKVPYEQRKFAHELIDLGAADIIHGHSSHHPKAIELYRGKLILFGCGDLINDYEGISGYEEYRHNLSLLYFVTMCPSAKDLVDLAMIPMQIERFSLRKATVEQAEWLVQMFSRETTNTNVRYALNKDNIIRFLKKV